MLDSSKDILNYVLAFCILGFTVFLCWGLFYMISIVGNLRKIVKTVHEKIEKIDSLIDLLREKIEHSATYLALIVEGVTKLTEYFKTKKEASNLASKKTKKDSE